MDVAVTRFLTWAASAACRAFRDAACVGLGLGLLLTPVVLGHGDTSARLLARSAGLGDASGALALARLAVVGGHALMVCGLVVFAGFASLAARICWPGLLWCWGKLRAELHLGRTATDGRLRGPPGDRGSTIIVLCLVVVAVGAVISVAGGGRPSVFLPSLATVCATIILMLAALAAKPPRKG